MFAYKDGDIGMNPRLGMKKLRVSIRNIRNTRHLFCVCESVITREVTSVGIKKHYEYLQRRACC